jgi:hypothetical protein
MSDSNLDEITLEDHKNGFNEVAFLLDIFCSTIDNIMGGATAPVGRIAGREMAKKMPVHLENPSINEAVSLLADRMKNGFEFSFDDSAEQKQLNFGMCALRQACSLREVQPGGAMCRLFHSYFDGILNELVSRPVKSEIIACGNLCSVTLRTQ